MPWRAAMSWMGCRSPAVVQRQIEHRLDGVLALRRDPHARPCSMSRASVLREVRDDDVGARRGGCRSAPPASPAPRRASRAARRRGSSRTRPTPSRRPPGSPNSPLTRAITSRYGSAGFTITMSAPSSTSSATSRIASMRVGGIHLVGAPVAELRGGVGRLAERPVERGGVLRRVGHDRRLLVARLVERLADRGRRGRPSCRTARPCRRPPPRGTARCAR